MKDFPLGASKDMNISNTNLSIQLYGHRIHESQTVGEYLLEFLVVFNGANDGKGGIELDSGTDLVSYKIHPNIGLKRFVFLENSKTINRFRADEEANDQLNRIIKQTIQSDNYTQEQALYVIKDLLYGFSLITQQRGWFAQSMIPLCKNVIFCEAMGNKAVRKNMEFKSKIDSTINQGIDKDFGFNQHNFLARGGEVYYLHLLQGLEEYSSKHNESQVISLRNEINNGIRKLISGFPELEELTEFIQNNWESYLYRDFNKLFNDDNKSRTVKEHHEKVLKCAWIKDSYKKYSIFTLSELKTLVSTSMNEFDKLELLNIGIVLQLFRVMTYEAYAISMDDVDGNPIWLLHVPSETIGDEKVKTLAVKFYTKLENYMMNALDAQLKLNNVEDPLKVLKDAYNNSHKLFRKIGKEIGLIVPLSGSNMRLTISDNIIRFLVVALIEPSTSITLDRFLEKLYQHYGIVVREKEFTSHFNKEKENMYAPYLKYNHEAFIFELKANGFLKELSDATAIVTNPYGKMEEYQ